jgi:ferritin
MQAIAIAGYRGENFRVVANQKIIAATNEQIGNTPGNFLQWFVKEQLEEVASMKQLRPIGRPAGEDLRRVKENLAREKGRRVVSSEEE